MARRWIVWFALGVSTAALTGCGGTTTVESGAAEEPKPHAVALAELLKEPRATLAQKGDEQLAQVRTRDQARRRGSLKLTLLPGWFEPLVMPGLHDAKYQADLGFSVPSYVDAKKPTDATLALHYARFGDHEAAGKLLGGQAHPALDAFKLDQNFPLEWSRLVAIQVHSLAQRLAAGDKDALPELISTHQQLTTLLNGKAATSPLAQDLLARGRTALAAAAKAWREKGVTDRATEAEAALAKWPDERPALLLRGDKNHWAQQLKVTAQGEVLTVAPAARALDWLQLPLGREGAEAALLFFDSRDLLRHVLITYNPGVRRECEQAAELAGGLNAWATPTNAGKNGPCLHQWEGITVETSLCPVNETFGGWVRLDLKKDATAVAVTRGLAQAHLDCAFEVNRLAVAPQQQGDRVLVAEQPGLARVENPLPAAKLLRLELTRVEGQDLLHEAAYAFQTGVPLHQVAGPLFARLGPGRIANEADDARTYLTLAWEDATTQVMLRLPDDAHVPTSLVLRDRRAADKSAERLAAVAAFEKAERAQRLQSHQPQQRLPRKVEQFPLGMVRSELLKFMPQGRSVVKRDVGDTLVVAVNVPTPTDRAYLVRHIVARFDSEQKLTWVRVRYEAAGLVSKQPNWPQQLLAAWRSAGGAVSAGPSPYLAHETGLPPQSPAGKFYHWKDDVTEATCLVDRSGVEVTLKNRTPGDEPTAPLTYLPRGQEGLHVGMTLSELKAVFAHEPESTPDGGLIFRPTKGPFDALVVWPEGATVRQIAGRYRTGATAKTTPAELEKALMTQWATELATIGWPTRRDFTDKVLQSLTWFDDATRYRIYWAESNNSPARLWSEWREERVGGR